MRKLIILPIIALALWFYMVYKTIFPSQYTCETDSECRTQCIMKEKDISKCD